MRAIQAIEDFFRGAMLITGSLLAIGILLLAGLFLVTGVMMAYTYNTTGYIWLTLQIVAVIVSVPVIVLLIGRRFRG